MVQKQLNNKNAGFMLTRIGKLEPGSIAEWGKLSVTGMMYHYVTVTKEILQAPQSEKKPTLKQQLFKIVGLYLMAQFPKGVKSSDKYTAASAQLDFEREKECLINIVKHAAAYDKPIYGEHPFFGPMQTRDWKRFLYKHLDHHLRQFGV